MGVRKWTDAEKQAAREAYEQVGPREAARLLNIPRGTIAAWADKHNWQTSVTENMRAAAERNDAEYRLRRAGLRVRLLDIIEDLAARVGSPHVEHKVVDKDLVEIAHDVPPADAVYKYLLAIGIAIDKVRLEEGLSTSRGENTVTVTARDEVLAEVTGLLAAKDRQAG